MKIQNGLKIFILIHFKKKYYNKYYFILFIIKIQLVEQLKLLLDLNVSDFILVQFKKPSDLTKAIGTCPDLLKVDPFLKDILLNEQIKKAKLKKRKTSALILNKILNFIFNIPSDYYRMTHPRKLLL